MPETRACVSDTHALLFHAAGGRQLGRRAARHFQACENRSAIVHVPAAVVWETSCLVRVGRVDLKRPLRSFFGELFGNPAYQLLELDLEQVLLADEARPGPDPFDALICAAARSLDLPLLTRDESIASWGLVRTIW